MRTKENLQQPEPEPELSRHPVGSVTIDYDGILSGKLTWQSPLLETFTQRADLRSQVVVRRGHQRPEVVYTDLGEVLAWRQILNPFDLFKNISFLGAKTRLEANPHTGDAVLYLNDQIIAEEVEKANRGRFDEQIFAGRLNRAVHEGLQNVLAWEKKYQLRISAITTPYDVFIMGAYPYVATYITREFLTALFQNGNFLVGHFLGTGFFILTSALGYQEEIKSIKEHGVFFTGLADRPETQFLPFRYRCRLVDDLPPKHLRDWLRGAFFLKTKGKNLVKLQ